jgi:hypothetical protein
MTVINTSRNKVHAHAIGDDDAFVRISLLGYDEAGTRVARHLPYQPISDYNAAVAWAIRMADQLAYPIHVVPLSYSDIRNTGRFTPIADAVASMDDQQRGAMRQTVVTTACSVMRDCDDPEIRADMFDVLRQLKVIRHES